MPAAGRESVTATATARAGDGAGDRDAASASGSSSSVAVVAVVAGEAARSWAASWSWTWKALMVWVRGGAAGEWFVGPAAAAAIQCAALWGRGGRREGGRGRGREKLGGGGGRVVAGREEEEEEEAGRVEEVLGLVVMYGGGGLGASGSVVSEMGEGMLRRDMGMAETVGGRVVLVRCWRRRDGDTKGFYTPNPGSVPPARWGPLRVARDGFLIGIKHAG